MVQCRKVLKDFSNRHRICAITRSASACEYSSVSVVVIREQRVEFVTCHHRIPHRWLAVLSSHPQSSSSLPMPHSNTSLARSSNISTGESISGRGVALANLSDRSSAKIFNVHSNASPDAYLSPYSLTEVCRFLHRAVLDPR